MIKGIKIVMHHCYKDCKVVENRRNIQNYIGLTTNLMDRVEVKIANWKCAGPGEISTSEISTSVHPPLSSPNMCNREVKGGGLK